MKRVLFTPAPPVSLLLLFGAIAAVVLIPPRPVHRERDGVRVFPPGVLIRDQMLAGRTLTLTLSRRTGRGEGTAKPIDRAIAVGGADGTTTNPSELVRRPLALLEGSGGLAAQFSSDGKLLLTAGENSARPWDARTFAPVTDPLVHSGKITVAVLSEDGTKILTAGKSGSARVWDARTGKMLCAVLHSCGIVAAGFDRAGKRIITGGDRDKTAAVWDAASGRLLHLLHLPDATKAVEFSPKGDQLLASTDDALCVYDAATGELVASTVAHDADESMDHAVFSLDGTKIAVAGVRRARIFGAATLRQTAEAQLREHDDPFALCAVALSADGRKYAVGTTGFVRVGDAITGNPLTGRLETDPDDSYTKVIFSRDGKLLFAIGSDPSGRNVWGLWDAKTGRRLALMRVGRGAKGGALSPDGTLVAAGAATAGDTAIWKLAREGQ